MPSPAPAPCPPPLFEGGVCRRSEFRGGTSGSSDLGNGGIGPHSSGSCEVRRRHVEARAGSGIRSGLDSSRSSACRQPPPWNGRAGKPRRHSRPFDFHEVVPLLCGSGSPRPADDPRREKACRPPKSTGPRRFRTGGHVRKEEVSNYGRSARRVAPRSGFSGDPPRAGPRWRGSSATVEACSIAGSQDTHLACTPSRFTTTRTSSPIAPFSTP
jgi:hypothetical protein